MGILSKTSSLQMDTFLAYKRLLLHVNLHLCGFRLKMSHLSSDPAKIWLISIKSIVQLKSICKSFCPHTFLESSTLNVILGLPLYNKPQLQCVSFTVHSSANTLDSCWINKCDHTMCSDYHHYLWNYILVNKLKVKMPHLCSFISLLLYPTVKHLG